MATIDCPHPTRRGFCRMMLGGATMAAAGGALAPSPGLAASGNLVDTIHAEAARNVLKTRSLRGGITVLSGCGGNIAVLAGPDGTLLVDAGLSIARPHIQAALSTLGSEPVTHLVNTHWHFDHTEGNVWLNAAGAAIMAHENTARHLASNQRVDDWDFTFPALPEAGRPTETIGDERTLTINGTTIAIKPYGPAHTDGDLSVFFQESNVLHTGDTFWNGIFPFIDYSTGGHIDGMIAAAEANIAAVDADTLIIPGQGPVGNKRHLVGYRNMLVNVRDRVAGLKRSGHSLEEAIAAKASSKYNATWGNWMISPRMFVQLAYEGV